MATSAAGHPGPPINDPFRNVSQVSGVTELIAQGRLQALLKRLVNFVPATKATEDDEAKFPLSFLDPRIGRQTRSAVDDETNAPPNSQAKRRHSPEQNDMPPERSPKVSLMLGGLHFEANCVSLIIEITIIWAEAERCSE